METLKTTAARGGNYPIGAPQKARRVRPLVILAGLLAAIAAAAPAAFMLRTMNLEYPAQSLGQAFLNTWTHPGESLTWGAAWIGLAMWATPLVWKAVMLVLRGLLRPNAPALSGTLTGWFIGVSRPLPPVVGVLLSALVTAIVLAPGVILAGMGGPGVLHAAAAVPAGQPWGSFSVTPLGSLAWGFLVSSFGVLLANLMPSGMLGGDTDGANDSGNSKALLVDNISFDFAKNPFEHS